MSQKIENNPENKEIEIPKPVEEVIVELEKAGFEAYAVGGCVRDLLMDRKPRDWDVTTNAKPEKIKKILSTFAGGTKKNPATFSKNKEDEKFGTVWVKTGSKEENLKVIEVTTFRAESGYSDRRHPDKVEFVDSLEKDLARRDFTVNALALKIKNQKSKIKNTIQNSKVREYEIIDLFNGRKDLEDKIIRAVGDPDERFKEDALRMMRAVRFAVELGLESEQWEIDPETFKALKDNVEGLKAISKERVRDEFIKIIMSSRADRGIELLREAGLLKYIIPELEKGIGVSQNRHHIYSIYEHNVLSLAHASNKNYNLVVRLAALLHDIAKPQVKRGEGPDSTFYNHDIVGAKFAKKILERLKFPQETIEKVCNLIRNHMFVYDVGAVTEAGVRRVLKRVGPENMEDLIALREADRIGSGVPKAQPYRLRHFQYMVEKVQNDPISVKMLKVDGHDIMEILKMEKGGPIIGAIQDVLLAEVIEDPKLNTKEYQAKRVKELAKMDLAKLREMAKEKIEEKQEEDDQVIKNKYWVK